MTTTHVIEAFCPSCTLVFFGAPHLRMGLVRDFSVQEERALMLGTLWIRAFILGLRTCRGG